jgi:hypothetical protein
VAGQDGQSLEGMTADFWRDGTSWIFAQLGDRNTPGRLAVLD